MSKRGRITKYGEVIIRMPDETNKDGILVNGFTWDESTDKGYVPGGMVRLGKEAIRWAIRRLRKAL